MKKQFLDLSLNMKLNDLSDFFPSVFFRSKYYDIKTKFYVNNLSSILKNRQIFFIIFI